MELKTTQKGLIHDVQMDFYGKQVATCSSDGKIQIFNIDGEKQNLVAELTDHEGPVWQISWSNPKFGIHLASCSNDGSVIIWKQINQNWIQEYQFSDFSSSVNSVDWAPFQFGLHLACGSSDGNIVILSLINGKWKTNKHKSHQVGVNSVCWGPFVQDQTEENQPKLQLVSGGGDSLVKIWRFEINKGLKLLETLNGHTSWVRCVAWRQTTSTKLVIASCSQDQTVIIWSKEKTTKQNSKQPTRWIPKKLSDFPDIVWHVSWSLTSNLISVSCGDSDISFWEENQDGEWIKTDFNQVVEQKN
ncbi:protein sec13 [Anaeramoeba flamelloides]|uniref:Protein sec13 n=1 Tax=Anaeramoeba flamelloides TaxID=1746091 RepID=A0ABQ8Y6X2_9EUKA|nr:protein sec13 [Anaeramoeba flamelloides]